MRSRRWRRSGRRSSLPSQNCRRTYVMGQGVCGSSWLDQRSYALTNSNRSAPPSVSRALKRTLSVFLFSVLHSATVSRLYSTLHTHPRSHRLWSVLPAHPFLASRMAVSEGAIMQLPVYRLRRILLLRTWVNKEKRSQIHREFIAVRYSGA
jgi:hypothetical protein